MANTNPTNAASLFEIVDATREANGNFSLIWSTVGGTRYRIQYADQMNGPFNDLIRFIDTEMDSSPHGTASTQSFTDNFTQTGASTNNARYYRVKVAP
jgi:hypothetical protein